jgi:2-amino-4-hydroxy-6-hydroxymethyldihydropteridine diphosphokinase/dihydropteroate synthase
MKVTLGLGANEGDRLKNIENACRKIQALPYVKKNSAFRVSPLYETPALLPERAPGHWNVPFLNLVIEVEFDSNASEARPNEILKDLQKIERELGRGPHERWAPRPIDIDILLLGDQSYPIPPLAPGFASELTVPHPRMMERAFVLDPLKDLDPSKSRLLSARQHPQHSPLWMGVLNVTPDSFSNEGLLRSSELTSWRERLSRQLDSWDDHFVAIIDVGAESTRPGATPVSSHEEWSRLEPILIFLKERYHSRLIRPLISLDTRFAETAQKALETASIDIINDVSGLSDPRMLELLLNTRYQHVQYVLMHSLSVPADTQTTLINDCDPVAELLQWFEGKISDLQKSGVDSSRILIDPGIGFGKTAIQSLEILRNIDRFTRLPYRVLVGHSRKSFLNPWTKLPAEKRDLESIGVSLSLAARGVDVLRVHEPTQHIRAFRAGNHIHRNSPL